MTMTRLANCPSSPNCVSSEASDGRHEISPLTFSGSPAEAFLRLRQVLGSRKDTVIRVDEPDYLRVEFRTLLFVDDGEFVLRKDRIDIRSASRVGYWDLGKNRRRIEEIRQAFSAPERVK